MTRPFIMNDPFETIATRAPATIGSAMARPSARAAEVQATIVTLDREWAAALADELRAHHMPTLLPASPARWRQHFDGARPNCVIFDLDHGGEGALDAIAALKAESAQTMIVAAATAPTIKTVVAAMRAGATDFVNKRQALKTAREQIEQAAEQALGEQSASDETGEVRARIDALTPREREILSELAAGLATKQIAIRMELSPRTVEMFRTRIKRRLGAASIAEAIGMWLQHRDGPRLRVVG